MATGSLIYRFQYMHLSLDSYRPKTLSSRAPPHLNIPELNLTPTLPESEPLVGLASKYPVLPDPDITISFDRGRQIVKAHRMVLCEQSAWFRKALEGYFKEHGATALRIRGDFPFAIQAMFNFIYTDNYPSYGSIRASLHERYPRTTELDYHVLVYTAADKYDIPAMRALATKNYMELVEDILKMDFAPLIAEQDVADDISTTAVFEEDIMPFAESNRGIEAQFYRFINSLTLVWAKTPSRQDGLRYAVIELIKKCLPKLMHCAEFVMLLMGDAAFYEDLEESCEENGLRFWVETGRNSRHPLSFEC